MQIKPLNDWAVIVPSEAVERTAGGLYIPDAAKEKPAEGVVEAIGPGALEEETWKEKKGKKKKERKFIPTTVKPGERVLYERYAATKIDLGGTERLLVRERNILGIFTGNPSSAKPLLLPAATATSDTSLAKIALTAITANAPAQPMKKSGGKAPATAVAKGQKKAATKPTKKAAKKKVAAKPKKAGQKAAKKKVKKKR